MRLTQPQPVRVPLAGRRPGEDFLGPDGKPTRLNEVLTEEDFDRVKAAPTPAVFFDEVAALMYPARVYGDWLLALGLPDLAEKARTQLATTTTAATARSRSEGCSRASQGMPASSWAVGGRRRWCRESSWLMPPKHACKAPEPAAGIPRKHQ